MDIYSYALLLKRIKELENQPAPTPTSEEYKCKITNTNGDDFYGIGYIHEGKLCPELIKGNSSTTIQASMIFIFWTDAWMFKRDSISECAVLNGLTNYLSNNEAGVSLVIPTSNQAAFSIKFETY